MIDSFRLDAYLAYIDTMSKTRPVVPADHHRPSEPPWLALQHDIDLNLGWAVEVAEKEAELELSACYYLQVGCPFYDIAAPESRSAIQRLIVLHHEIGLHFDWRRYEAAGITLERGLLQDADVLESIAERRVEAVCAHMPLRNGRPDATGFRTPQVEGEVYVSDSARGFRDGPLKALLDPPEKLRLNMHPAWWVGPSAPERPVRDGILDRATYEAHERIDIERADWTNVNDHPNAIDQDRRNRDRTG